MSALNVTIFQTPVLTLELGHHIHLTLPIISDELLGSPAFHTPYSPIEDYIPMIPVSTQQTNVISLTAPDEQQKTHGTGATLCIDSEDWKLPSDDLLTDSESGLPCDK